MQLLGLKVKTAVIRMLTVWSAIAIIFCLAEGMHQTPALAAEADLSVVSAAYTDSLGKKIIIEFTEPVTDPAGNEKQFSVQIDDVKSTVVDVSAGNSDSQIILTLLEQIPYSSSPQEIVLSYTMGTVMTADGELLPSFANLQVVNRRLSLELADYEPSATEIACLDDGAGGKILKYLCDNPIDYDNVNLALYFSKGFFKNFEDNLKDYVKFYEKNSGNTVPLPNTVTVGIQENGKLPLGPDGKGYMEITDWYFKQVSGRAPLGLALQSRALKPSTTYVIEVQKGFAFNSGSAKNSYLFEFTTTAVSQYSPYWTGESSLTASGLTETGLTLKWPAARDNHGTGYDNLHYNIYQNGSLIAYVDGNTTIYNVTNLTPATEYRFKVEAVDFAGNTSTNHLETTVHTPGNTTLLPAPALTANNSENTPGSEVELTFTDDAAWRAAINSVTVEGTVLTGGQYTVTAGKITIGAGVLAGAGNYTVVVNATGYNPATAVITMVAEDTGNDSGETGNTPDTGVIDRSATMVDFEPAATLISSRGNSELYRYNKSIDYERVELVWYFSFGFFNTFVDNLDNHVRFYNKETGRNVELPNYVTVPITENNYYMEVTDWWFKRISGKVPLGLTLKSTSLEPATTYVIEIGPGFEFNNGLTLDKAYIFEFTTTEEESAGTTTPDGEENTEQALNPEEVTVTEPEPENPVEQEKTVTQVSFNDLNGHWAETNIKQLVAAGIINGYPDHTFKPDDIITRAEFCTALVKALELQGDNGVDFADTTGHWARDYIATAAAKGIVHGMEENHFAPDEPLTREQMALMIYSSKKMTTLDGMQEFKDVNHISHWALNAVKTVSAKKIISGYPDNTFRPQNFASRAEAATAIVNLLSLSGDDLSASGE